MLNKNFREILKNAKNSKSPKIKKDAERIAEILDGKHEPTDVERFELLKMLQANPHKGGKIEGATSMDSSCTGCTFCQKMREAARKLEEANANKDPNTEELQKIICGTCYDADGERYKINSRDRHGLNLVILSNVLFTEQELTLIPIWTLIGRFNACGDIENETHARNYLRVAKTHPMTRFGFWTKNAAEVDKAIKAEGKPANVKMIYSDPIINGSKNIQKILKKYTWIDTTFTVYDEDHIAEAIANGANPCNGKNCNPCGWKCYTDDGWKKGSNTAELLRK